LRGEETVRFEARKELLLAGEAAGWAETRERRERRRRERRGREERKCMIQVGARSRQVGQGWAGLSYESGKVARQGGKKRKIG
jgi:hypothetical protein